VQANLWRGAGSTRYDQVGTARPVTITRRTASGAQIGAPAHEYNVATHTNVNQAFDAARRTGRIDASRVDATSELDIARHRAADLAEAMGDAGLFARDVRERLGLTQVEFAARIHVSLDTIRNWEQGKRCPTGAAKALLRVLHRAPEVALAALL
jgi:putative transcriptional regulator